MPTRLCSCLATMQEKFLSLLFTVKCPLLSQGLRYKAHDLPITKEHICTNALHLKACKRHRAQSFIIWITSWILNYL